MKNSLVTLGLIIANLIVYVMMLSDNVSFFEPTAQQILEWGGSQGIKTVLEGQWWRLITYMFVHIGFIHILMNMYILYDIGMRLELIIGSLRFAAIYLATGIFGGLVGEMWYASTHTIIVSAGASGAVFGIIGVFFALITTNLFEKDLQYSLFKRVGSLILVNLVYGIQSHVNMAAHMGGFISGFVLGYLLYPSIIYEYSKKIVKPLTIGAIVLITVFSSVGMLKSLKKADFFQYHSIVSEYQSLEVIINNHLDEMPLNHQAAVGYINSTILPDWEKAMTLARKAKALSMKGEGTRYRDYLVEWITLNHKKYKLVEQGMKDLSITTQMEIETINDQLTKLNNSIAKTP